MSPYLSYLALRPSLTVARLPAGSTASWQHAELAGKALDQPVRASLLEQIAQQPHSFSLRFSHLFRDLISQFSQQLQAQPWSWLAAPYDPDRSRYCKI